MILLTSAVWIAMAACPLVWMIEAMRTDELQHYEPKDLERARHEVQRELKQPKPFQNTRGPNGLPSHPLLRP